MVCFGLNHHNIIIIIITNRSFFSRFSNGFLQTSDGRSISSNSSQKEYCLVIVHATIAIESQYPLTEENFGTTKTIVGNDDVLKRKKKERIGPSHVEKRIRRNGPSIVDVDDNGGFCLCPHRCANC